MYTVALNTAATPRIQLYSDPKILWFQLRPHSKHKSDWLIFMKNTVTFG